MNSQAKNRKGPALATVHNLDERRIHRENIERARILIEPLRVAARAVLAEDSKPTLALHTKVWRLSDCVMEMLLNLEDTLPSNEKTEIEYKRELAILERIPSAREFVERRAHKGNPASRRALAEWRSR